MIPIKNVTPTPKIPNTIITLDNFEQSAFYFEYSTKNEYLLQKITFIFYIKIKL